MKEIILLGILLFVGVTSAQFVYDNPTLPKINQNNNTNLTGGQIPTNNVNKTTGTYFLSELLDSIIDQLYVMISTSTNTTFINDTYVPYTGANKNVDLGNHNLTTESLNLKLGGQVCFDKTNCSKGYIFYNDTSKRVELWANNKIQQDWGNSTTIYGKATFQADAFFQNLSGTGLLINTNVLVQGNVSSENIFTGNVCYSDGTNCTFINSSFTNLTDYVNNINQSLTNLSKVNTYYEYINLTTSGGIGSNISINNINFLITRITVTPSSLTTTYRFSCKQLSDNTMIDNDKMVHRGVWDIYKTHSISNDKVVVNITNSNPDDSYIIKVTYSSNFK